MIDTMRELFSGLNRHYKLRRLKARDDAKLSRRERFAAVYRTAMWGRSPEGAKFFSGDGSLPENTARYERLIQDFCLQHNISRIVEIGCGDFQVAERILKELPGVSYVGCDIVPDLIEHHQKTFADERISFRCLDAVEEELPIGDLLLVREVFQHLANSSIQTIISKATRSFPYLISTECHSKKLWKPNIDYVEGGSARTKLKSGVLLNLPPFNVPCEELLVSEHLLNHHLMIRTVLIRGQQGA